MDYINAICIFFIFSIGHVINQSNKIDIAVSTAEEQPEGTFVANLSAYPSLFQGVSPENRSKLTYNILSIQNNAMFFKIDSKSGVISVATRIDREKLCEFTFSPCLPMFSVAIQGSSGLSFSNIANVKVDVEDINDNPPNFPADEVTLEISEGAKVGTVNQISGPQDLDSSPNNTIQRYELVMAENVFSISATANLDGSSIVNLRLEKDLDRENVSEYHFIIIAYDGGNPPLNDSIKVNIKVADENDCTPVFENRSYSTSLRVNATVGSPILRVHATDRDSGAYGTVRYRFSSIRSDVVDRMFEINDTSGTITLKSPLDNKPGETMYNLIVEALDGGNPPSIVQTVVTINVLKSGNNPPIVRIVTVSEGDTSEIQITESAARDDFVAFVNVEDSDQGKDGEVNCSMNSASQFRLEELLNKGYKILLNSAVDRELVKAYDAAILCNDNGSPALTTTTTFKVIITDVNDNAPRFQLVGYSASIDENNSLGQYILQVTATDADEGNNSVITYGFLEPGAESVFNIHPQTGIITAVVRLDRETTPNFLFTLTATDGGNPTLTGSSRLTITIRDVNDNFPQLADTPYWFSVSEAAQERDVVGLMSASDFDEGLNGEVEFFFAGSVNGNVPFTVHPDGKITVSGGLDRESAASYVFTVLVRDKGNIPKSNSTQVTIRITDVNDNAPMILFPTTLNHSVIVDRAPEVDTVLSSVIGYDLDEGNASKLVYSISGGDEENVFDIDANSGKITFRNIERLQNPHTYFLVFKVSDFGKPTLYAEARLQVEVSFLNITFLTRTGDDHSNSEVSRESYVIIVGVIGGATLVLSGIIIFAILFVLRSERQRKTRSKDDVYKNAFLDTIPDSCSDAPDSKEQKTVSPRSSQGDNSASSIMALPKSAPPKPEVQKKVSFSLDEPDGDVQKIQAVGLPTSSLSQQQLFQGVEGDPDLAWKRITSPDDFNSDVSGDSGTYDSGRGASDDDIHLDISLEKTSNCKSIQALMNSSRKPARNNYTSPNSVFASFGLDHEHGQGPSTFLQHRGSSSRSRLLQTGSYHEGRSDNFRKIQLRPSPQPPAMKTFPSSPLRSQMATRHTYDIDGHRFSPRPPSSLSSYQMQSSAMSMDDDASTTTSGSYTIMTEENRLEGVVSNDVIV